MADTTYQTQYGRRIQIEGFTAGINNYMALGGATATVMAVAANPAARPTHS